MKKILALICCCVLIACNKNSSPAPKGPPKPLQIVVSNITTTLTIYSFSVVNQSSVKLIDIHSQTENKTYTVNVNPGDVLKVNYFLELEGLRPATNPVITVVCDGVIMATVTNDAGIISGAKYITVP